MKTFEQFLNEAGAYGMDRRVNQTFFATGGAASAHKPGRLVTQRAEDQRAEQNKEREQKGLPSGTTISDSEKSKLKAQVEAKKSVQHTEQKPKTRLEKAAEILAARKQDPEFQAQQKKAEQARNRSAQRAARKAQNS